MFWTENAWDLSSPISVLLIGAATAITGLLLLWLIARFGVDARAAALGVATGILILTHWHKVFGVPTFLKIILPFIVGWVANRLARSKLLDVVTVIGLAVFGIAPLLQLAIVHIEQAATYPTVALAARQPAEATGAVEDAVVVIVDSYPSLRLAEDFYGHDTSVLVNGLTANEFDVRPVAWSQQTFTALSVPSLMELQPVGLEGPLTPSQNINSLNRIMRGDSLVATTLQSAGFTYTHIESGTDGLTCGGNVDRCIHSPWINESVWQMTRTTVAARWMEDNLGSYVVEGTLSAAQNLIRVGQDLIGNGSHDYIFAHLFLPHPPVVVDADCEVLDGAPLPDPKVRMVHTQPDYLEAYNGQLSCADGLLVAISSMAGPSTAMLITADHGPGMRVQVARDGRTWSDADIAERLGILLAYHLPDACDDPVDDTNVDVMRALVPCAVTMELPARRPIFLLGSHNPVAVAPDRLASIRSQVESGTLQLSDP